MVRIFRRREEKIESFLEAHEKLEMGCDSSLKATKMLMKQKVCRILGEPDGWED